MTMGDALSHADALESPFAFVVATLACSIIGLPIARTPALGICIPSIASVLLSAAATATILSFIVFCILFCFFSHIFFQLKLSYSASLIKPSPFISATISAKLASTGVSPISLITGFVSTISSATSAKEPTYAGLAVIVILLRPNPPRDTGSVICCSTLFFSLSVVPASLDFIPAFSAKNSLMILSNSPAASIVLLGGTVLSMCANCGCMSRLMTLYFHCAACPLNVEAKLTVFFSFSIWACISLIFSIHSLFSYSPVPTGDPTTMTPSASHLYPMSAALSLSSCEYISPPYPNITRLLLFCNIPMTSRFASTCGSTSITSFGSPRRNVSSMYSKCITFSFPLNA